MLISVKFGGNHQKVDFHNFGPPEHSKNVVLRQHSRLGAKSEDFEGNSQNSQRSAKIT